MDDELRRAERSGDWRTRATALRRAGRRSEARRVLASAVRRDPEAWGLLDAWFPLGAEERGLMARLSRPAGGRFAQQRWEQLRVAKELLGVGDPRFDAVLREFDVEGLGDEVASALGALVERDPSSPDRLVAAVARFGFAVLARVEPTPDEVQALLEAFPLEGLTEFSAPLHVGEHEGVSLYEQGTAGLMGLALIQLAGRFGDERSLSVLERLPTAQLHPVTVQERWEALWARGRAGEGTRPRLPDGWPLRPDWVGELGLPVARLRDPLTLAIHRRCAAERWPSVFDGPGSASHRVLLIGLDHFRWLNDRYGFQVGDERLNAVTRSLQSHFGDRVVRYAGDEWLVPWEGGGLEQVAEAARAEVAASARDPALAVVDSQGAERLTTISGGIGRTVREADEHLYAAKAGGRDQIVSA